MLLKIPRSPGRISLEPLDRVAEEGILRLFPRGEWKVLFCHLLPRIGLPLPIPKYAPPRASVLQAKSSNLTLLWWSSTPRRYGRLLSDPEHLARPLQPSEKLFFAHRLLPKKLPLRVNFVELREGFNRLLLRIEGLPEC